MSDVQRLLAEFVAEDRGDVPADPVRYLDQVEGRDREELAVLIDAYLQRAPRRRVTSATVSSSARAVSDAVERSLFGDAGTWPLLLPRLRERAKLSRRVLVAQLAERLAVDRAEQRVADYYHRMETGLIDPDGVTDRVLEALGALLGTSARRLRDAGRAIAPLRPALDAAAYARTAAPDPELAQSAPPPAAGDGDERAGDDGTAAVVDALFTGGRGGQP